MVIPAMVGLVISGLVDSSRRASPGYGLVWFKAPLWGSGDRGFKSLYPDVLGQARGLVDYKVDLPMITDRQCRMASGEPRGGARKLPSSGCESRLGGPLGAIAQSGRAPLWQGGSRGFESLWLHEQFKELGVGPGDREMPIPSVVDPRQGHSGVMPTGKAPALQADS